MRRFGRRRDGAGSQAPPGGSVLVIGLGNPGSRYAGTRHNAGFEVAAALSSRWDLPRARKRYGGLIADGRTEPGGTRVAVLLPQTFMNESGEAASPARGELGIGLDRIVALHDEIDLPFGEVRAKLGGGVAGHNGLKSLERGLGGRDFWRIRIGVGRPDSTDPEVVSRYVLGRFSESPERVRELFEAAADEAAGLVARIDAEPNGEEGP
jgi:PTH1 family peptidyl-tRNA hydrolase